jgi:hypothetical protein
MESENLFLRAQEPAIGPISEPDESRQQLPMTCQLLWSLPKVTWVAPVCLTEHLQRKSKQNLFVARLQI